jgi:hypothetical protein
MVIWAETALPGSRRNTRRITGITKRLLRVNWLLWEAFIGIAFGGNRVIPPEIIVPNRVKDSPGSLRVNYGRDFRFFLAFVKESIHGHHPPNEETMSFNSLKAIRRTRRKARAAVPINGRNMFSVKIHQPEGGIETSCLIRRRSCLSKSFAVRAEDQESKNQKG